MKQQNIAIVGGSGFVGRDLAVHLTAQGHSVKILTRYREKCRHLMVIPQIDIVQGDVHNEMFLNEQFHNADCVVNLVGILNEFRGHGSNFEAAHVGLTKSILKASNARGVGKLVYLSSLKADAEDAPSEYLRSKGRAESLIKRNKESNLKWSILQPSLLFGEHDSFVNRFAKLLKIPNPLFLLPRANARVAPAYVGDVVLAISRCITDTETHGGTFQLCGPHVYSLKEIMQLICTELKIKRKVIGLPDALSKIIAMFGRFIPGKPFTTDNYKSLTIHNICEIDGFARLGITPTSLTSIIRTYLGEHVKSVRYGIMRQSAGR